MMEKLIDLETIVIHETPQVTSGSQAIPDWVKKNTRWWLSNQISDSEFALGMEFLINEGIIPVSKN